MSRAHISQSVAEPQVMEKSMSALKVVGVLVALKATVTEKGMWRTHRKGKSKMWQTQISHSVADPRVKGSNVIHYVADPQVMKM